MGMIYIFTNPSFEEFVKIGYTGDDDVERRLKEANNCTFVPYAFRLYATYETDQPGADTFVHAIIDYLKPELRTIDSVEGRPRKREFFAMRPKDAYSFLENIAKASGTADRLKKYSPSEDEKKEQENARQTRANNFRFSDYGIPVGEILKYYNPTHPEDEKNGTTCVIHDDRYVEYEGEIWSMSNLARQLSGSKSLVQGPRYFKYKDEPLLVIRKRMDSETID